MTREQAVRVLEREFRERYPRARVTVTAGSDRFTVEVARSRDDCFTAVLDPDWAGRGSAILAMALRRRTG